MDQKSLLYKVSPFNMRGGKMEKWLRPDYRMKSLGEQDFAFHSHAQYEIYFFHRGDCKYLIHHSIYELQPGDIIIMDGLTAHRANPSKCEIYERSVVHFSPDWIKPVIEELRMPELLSPFKEMSNCLLRGEDEGERELILQSIKAMDRLKNDALSFHSKPVHEAELKILLLTILMQIYKLSKKENQQLAMPKSEKVLHVENIAHFIQDHFKNSMSLEDISAELNLSKFYLSRIFKEVTGTTVMDYVMTCRLNQVKFDLEMYPDRTLMELATESGFESPAHFSRFFKQRVGMTPSEYRKQKLKS
ncbi:AraC family transcriptional regulator [Lederbergia sp. NSJ-179]|uniref:AraC family transcriptional regulator n=1 Tax=Lederbergia sp. NSJ-179 TaxID=2931402 RepID=UPI001FD09C03|nr:AraC family transcriptional regulator [Lederbergia sp. NSJ-179]MCJ7842573.1 AraC family transcriptional regulator [Lederbergia sp. NSJ-179]